MYRWINQDRLPTSFNSQLARFPWYDATQINDVVPRIQPGTAWDDPDNGNAFMYVRAGAALAAGQLVAWGTPATDTVVNAGSTVATINLTNGGLTVNAEVGNWLYSEHQLTMRQIKANGAATITVSQRDLNSTLNQNDPDAFAAVPGNLSNVSIIRPWTVIVCTAALVPRGVALGTVTSGNYTVIQIQGLALVQAVGNVTATVVNAPAIPGAAGVITGCPVQGGAAAPVVLFTTGVQVIPQFAFAGAGPELIPCNVNMVAGN